LEYDSTHVSALGRVALAGLFATVPRLFYNVEVNGLDNDTSARRTYYAMAHKRDLDGIVPVPPILFHRGWRGLTSDVHFALRSDAFEPGFLARMVPHPRWLSLLLRPISVGPVLRGIGAHPLRSLRMRPAEAWLREALLAEGDQPAGELFAPAFLAEISDATRTKPDALGRLPLSRLLSWRFHAALQAYYGPEIFAGRARRRAERRVLAAAKEYLDDVAGWMRRGGSLYNGPEGQLSPDGRLSPITSGMHRLLHAAPPDARILPIALVYDFMTTGRPRLFVDLAPPIEAASSISRRQLDATLRAAWLRAARFTCTQIASSLLAEYYDLSRGDFTHEELAEAVYARAHALADAGRHVDWRLLTPHSVHQKVAHYLAYARRHGIVRRTESGVWRVSSGAEPLHVPLGEVGYPTAPLTYARNEYTEMLSASAPLETPAPLSPTTCFD
jgi:hypothetical protein